MDIQRRLSELRQKISRLEDEINEGNMDSSTLGELKALLDELSELEKAPREKTA